jgi:hypothetical protein
MPTGGWRPGGADPSLEKFQTQQLSGADFADCSGIWREKALGNLGFLAAEGCLGVITGKGTFPPAQAG